MIEKYEKEIHNYEKYIDGQWACEIDRISGMKIAVEVLKDMVKELQQLKSSLPTQQDKVVVPEFIKSTMEQYGSLQEMLTEEYYSDCTDEIDDDTVECWIDDNFDLLCRAWLNKSDNKLKLQFPQAIVDWLGTPLEDDHDELLSYIMRYYWNEDSAYDDTIPSEVGEYLAESLSNVVKLLRAVEGEPYTAAKEPLYYVRVGELAFVDWEDSMLAKMTTMDSPGWVNEANHFTTKDGADNIARIVGGEVVPVEEDE
ncbi:DUF1642 domain-containing protein [Enterococcus caccae]|uniref:DUF1642 domain-containing protein n=1 Tax=Enterococcus caccae TaxID=317735 RepID=UPI0011609038|nr:DUF1642 domain-containing protein [Enterococcus caccae]